MLRTNQESLTAIQPELMSGEHVLWAGSPSTKFMLHAQDALLIPFSLIWGGFAIFWELSATGHWFFQASRNATPSFVILWGIPFVLIGQDLIWGRFVYAAWLKKRTHYAVTDRRVLVLQDAWSRRTITAYLDTLPVIAREGGAGRFGTIRFGLPEPSPRGGNVGVWHNVAVGSVPVFVDLDDAEEVNRLVLDLRDKAEAKKGSRF